jgi:hypothetical protein|tara:strand:- start:457 stop:666 length:210 start_codon:yes stop_codon:yes gene_type:complete
MQAKWILHITYGDPLSLKPTQKAIGYFDSEEHAKQVASELYVDTNYIVEALPVTDLNIGEIESQKQGEK